MFLFFFSPALHPDPLFCSLTDQWALCIFVWLIRCQAVYAPPCCTTEVVVHDVIVQVRVLLETPIYSACDNVGTTKILALRTSDNTLMINLSPLNLERQAYLNLCCRWRPEMRKNVGNQWSVTKNQFMISLGVFINLSGTGFWSRSTDFLHFSGFPAVICSINHGPAHISYQKVDFSCTQTGSCTGLCPLKLVFPWLCQLRDCEVSHWLWEVNRIIQSPMVRKSASYRSERPFESDWRVPVISVIAFMALIFAFLNREFLRNIDGSTKVVMTTPLWDVYAINC